MAHVDSRQLELFGTEKQRKWTPEGRAAFLQAIRERYPAEGAAKLADDFGVTTSTVFTAAKRLRVRCETAKERAAETRRHQHDERMGHVERSVMSRYAAEGAIPLAQEFRLPVGTIHAIALRKGIRCRTFHERSRETRRMRNLAENRTASHSFFDAWTPSMAWLVGYTWADGCVIADEGSRNGWASFGLRYACMASDEHILHNIKEELRCPGSIVRHARPSRPSVIHGRVVRSGESVSLHVSSRPLAEAIMRIGVLPNKSHIDPEPPKIPDEWLGHFCRGLCDGDGTIYHRREPRTTAAVYFLGSHKIIRWLHTALLRIHGISPTKIQQHLSSDKLSRAGWNRGQDVVRLLEWMYPPGDYLCLRRKHEMADRILREGLPILQGRQVERRRVCGSDWKSAILR